MGNKINSETIITNKRLNSIETQMFTFLGDRVMRATEVKDAFDGIASQKTINAIAEHSSFLNLDNGEIKTLDIKQEANINYSFSYQGGGANASLEVSGRPGIVANDEPLLNVPLKGIFHSLKVEVNKGGIGNWEFVVHNIEVISAAVPYERVVVAKQPITNNGSYETKRK